MVVSSAEEEEGGAGGGCCEEGSEVVARAALVLGVDAARRKSEGKRECWGRVGGVGVGEGFPSLDERCGAVSLLEVD